MTSSGLFGIPAWRGASRCSSRRVAVINLDPASANERNAIRERHITVCGMTIRIVESDAVAPRNWWLVVPPVPDLAAPPFVLRRLMQGVNPAPRSRCVLA